MSELTPLTWKRLCELDILHKKLINDEVFRLPSIQCAYDKHLIALGDGIYDYIIKNVFQGDDMFVPWKVQDNKFPYYLENGIIHKVVWINPLCSLEQRIVVNYVIEMVIENDTYNCAVIQRSQQEQSIPQIRHFHLFLKRK